METPKRRKQFSFMAFNQDASCTVVGHNGGFRIYHCHPFAKAYESGLTGMGNVQLLFSTSLVSLVGSGDQANLSPRAVSLYNIKEEKSICELNFPSSVLSVQLNMSRMVAVLENRIHIFDLRTMKIIASFDTPPNFSGVCALSPNASNCYLVYPGHETKGELLLYDAYGLTMISVIQAHQNSVRLVAFNHDGTMLATASHRGTVIRVFSIPDGRKLHTFRRGTMGASIYSLAFNGSSNLLSVSSDSSTIHVFDLTVDEKPPSTVAAATSALSQYLPNMLQDVVEPSRSFAFVNLKEPIPPTLCAFRGDHTLFVLSAAGFMQRYTVPAQGGECKLDGEYSLLNAPSEAMGVKFHTRPADEEAGLVGVDSTAATANAKSTNRIDAAADAKNVAAAAAAVSASSPGAVGASSSRSSGSKDTDTSAHHLDLTGLKDALSAGPAGSGSRGAAGAAASTKGSRPNTSATVTDAKDSDQKYPDKTGTVSAADSGTRASATRASPAAGPKAASTAQSAAVNGPNTGSGAAAAAAAAAGARPASTSTAAKTSTGADKPSSVASAATVTSGKSGASNAGKQRPNPPQ